MALCLGAILLGRLKEIPACEISETTAQGLEDYPEQRDRHMAELRAILDEEGGIVRREGEQFAMASWAECGTR